MAGWSRLPPHVMKGPPRGLGYEPLPHFGRGSMGLLPPHPALLEEMREFRRGGLLGVLEERLAGQHRKIQALLVDNQCLTTTHVALKQELAAAQHELQRVSHAVAALHSDKDLQLRDVYEKLMKMESELQAVEAMRAELIQVRGDIQKLNAARQELMSQVQMLSQDVTRAAIDVQQAPAIRVEIETMKHEILQIRTGGDLVVCR